MTEVYEYMLIVYASLISENPMCIAVALDKFIFLHYVLAAVLQNIYFDLNFKSTVSDWKFAVLLQSICLNLNVKSSVSDWNFTVNEYLIVGAVF